MPRADTSDVNITSRPCSRNWSETLLRCDCERREWISSTGIPIAWKSSAKNWVWRAVVKNTMSLKSGSIIASWMIPTSSRIWCSLEVMRNCCSTCWCVFSSAPTVSMNEYCCRIASCAMLFTSPGIVAEKSSVCRVSFGGSRASMAWIAGRKPMSSSWSASSKIMHRRFEHSLSSPEFSRWSLSRPGVATSIAGWSRKPVLSLFMLVPPTTTITLTPWWNLTRRRASS
mmetsp:Transcript_64590/g.154114  ORF Transcript_64590/g.154114 Transcript_64590/m.154114 type:complete len:228 (-) Transcript_64590:458-1141(-)